MSHFLPQTQGLEITPSMYNYILKLKQEARVYGFQKKKIKNPQLMLALLRDWLHKRQFKTTSVKLLPHPQLSSVTWVRDDPHQISLADALRSQQGQSVEPSAGFLQ